MQGFWLVPILGGAYYALRGLFDLSLGRETAAWPTVRGWLVRADMGRSPFSRRGRRIESVHYRYRVDGHDYDGSLLGYRRFQNVQEAEGVLYRLSEDKQVQVHYDPARPERAVLLPGAGPTAVADLALGLILCAGGVLGYLWVAV